jgi:hypothetical protein
MAKAIRLRPPARLAFKDAIDQKAPDLVARRLVELEELHRALIGFEGSDLHGEPVFDHTVGSEDHQVDLQLLIVGAALVVENEVGLAMIPSDLELVELDLDGVLTGLAGFRGRVEPKEADGRNRQDQESRQATATCSSKCSQTRPPGDAGIEFPSLFRWDDHPKTTRSALSYRARSGACIIATPPWLRFDARRRRADANSLSSKNTDDGWILPLTD